MSKIQDADDVFKEANSQFVDEEYTKALSLYNDAIDMEPKRADFYEKRSACQYKLEKYEKAVEDADQAIKLNSNSSMAQLRKGMAYFGLNKFSEAKSCFEKGLQLDSDHSQIKTWLRKTNAELEARQEQAPQPAPSLKDKIRHNYYQMGSNVVVGIIGLASIKNENRKVQIDAEKIKVTIDLPNNETFEKEFHLFAKIDPSKSKSVNFTSKVEITLRKVDENIEWPSLEKSSDVVIADPTIYTDPNKYNPTVADPKKYPSSKGAKDWDKLENEQKDPENKDPDGLNQLFQQIYAGASEDARRAMLKSFTESNGTVLSTNWKDVGSKKVKMEAPRGMEAREYNPK
ncbi:hypothetical protein AKO1_015629 [Acrasis kona]|uniref:Uncharacterized protein n=1 Tax=Acrasis kona TaxID=1008807 RepID=A0AAW2ZGK2_9EUKA